MAKRIYCLKCGRGCKPSEIVKESGGNCRTCASGYPAHYTQPMIAAAEHEKEVAARARTFMPEIERVACDLADMYKDAIDDGDSAAAFAYQTAHDHTVLTCGIKRTALLGQWACNCAQCIEILKKRS